MTNTSWFHSPVKINLFLHVTGRRQDGYHLLQTLFQFLDYGDSIGLDCNTQGVLERIDNHQLPLPDEDLCIKAATALREAVGNQQLGATIHLKKVVPPGTGLGAGSSNAATVLVALNKLWELDLADATLLELAKTLGADVPVFVHGRATWAEGTGDRFSDCNPPAGWASVVIPPARVTTSEAFGDPALNRNHASVNFGDFIAGRTVNDLQQVVCKSNPSITEALDYLAEFGDARMSGTGSAVFVIVQSEDEARQIIQTLPADMEGFSARLSNRSMLHRALRNPEPL